MILVPTTLALRYDEDMVPLGCRVATAALVGLMASGCRSSPPMPPVGQELVRPLNAEEASAADAALRALAQSEVAPTYGRDGTAPWSVSHVAFAPGGAEATVFIETTNTGGMAAWSSWRVSLVKRAGVWVETGRSRQLKV